MPIDGSTLRLGSWGAPVVVSVVVVAGGSVVVVRSPPVVVVSSAKVLPSGRVMVAGGVELASSSPVVGAVGGGGRGAAGVGDDRVAGGGAVVAGADAWAAGEEEGQEGETAHGAASQTPPTMSRGVRWVFGGIGRDAPLRRRRFVRERVLRDTGRAAKCLLSSTDGGGAGRGAAAGARVVELK
jgi:hypothetical protein